jgi:hypothetical protein
VAERAATDAEAMPLPADEFAATGSVRDATGSARDAVASPSADRSEHDLERLLALNRQIARDLHRPPSPKYGRLLLLVLPTFVLSAIGFGAFHLTDRLGGASSHGLPAIGQSYQRTESALQQYRTLSQQLAGAVAPNTTP